MCWESMSSLHACATCTSPTETSIPTEMFLGKLKDALIKCGSKSGTRVKSFCFCSTSQLSEAGVHFIASISKTDSTLHPWTQSHGSSILPRSSSFFSLYGSESARPSHLSESKQAEPQQLALPTLGISSRLISKQPGCSAQGRTHVGIGEGQTLSHFFGSLERPPLLPSNIKGNSIIVK